MKMNPSLDVVRDPQTARPDRSTPERSRRRGRPALPDRTGNRPRRGLGLAAFAALGLLLPGGAALGDDGRPDLVSMSLEELMKIDVVYGASKYEQPTGDAPASITVVRSEEIARHGYETLAEVLANVRGFYTTYDRNYNYLGVRGCGRPGDYNTRVLILIDGVRQNDNVYGSSMVGTDFGLDLELIDRVEVIRGPGSSLYGTNAMFGVVNIITKGPAPETRAALEGVSGSQGLRSGRFVLSGARESGAKWLASGAAYRHRGGDHYYEVFNSAETNHGVARGVDRGEYRRLFGKGNWHELTFFAAHSRREKTIPTAPWGTVFNDPRNRTIDEYTRAGIRWQKPVGASTDVWSAAAFHRYIAEGDYVYEDPNRGPESSAGTMILSDEAIGEWWTLESRVAYRGVRNHSITAGLEGSAGRRALQKTYDPYEVYLSSDRPEWNWGAYVQDDSQVAPWCLLSGGSRLDVYQSFGTTLNPRAAAILRPAAGTRVKLLYGRAFRAPSAYESYYTDGGLTSKANPDLEPERIETTGGVIERYLGRGSFGTIELFQYRLQHLIDNIADPDDGLLMFDNRSKVRARGLEVGLRREWDSGLVGRMGVVLQETREGDTHQRLSNSPARLGYLNASLPLFGGRSALAFDARYVGRRTNPRGEPIRAYWNGDVTASAWVIPGRIRLLGRVRNVADVTYFDPGSTEHLQSSIEQDGRSWRLSVAASL